MHKLLRLSKETRDAVLEALVDFEIFLTQVSLPAEEKCCCCHQISYLTSITFSAEDMLVKNPNHDRLLYYIGYIRSTKVERMLIDPGSALSIMPSCLVQFSCMPIHKLSIIATIIHAFNAQSSQPVRKI